jgi:SRSO17 transposase
LPEAWANDTKRRRVAAVPETVAFQTKPAIAAEMIAAALDAGAPCAFVLADALYGADSRIRRRLEARQQPYVLATRSNHTLRLVTHEGLRQTDPRTLADAFPPEAWAQHAAGEGSKGPPLYDWARIALPWTVDANFERWLLIRRSRRDASERASYLVFTRIGTTLAGLAGAA